MSKNKKNTINESWNALFEKYEILNQVQAEKQYTITADQIREFKEPRLMAKFDHKIQLPEIFAENKLSILPITRGSYCIASFDTYKEFESTSPMINQFSLPDYIQSIDINNIYSEAVAINCAFSSGIFADFTGDENLVPTVSGRKGSGHFNFNITIEGDVLPISVANAQIEVDIALEGIDSLLLVEAKNNISSDFIIRQLFYPYKTWIDKISKPVRPIFLVYSNSIFTLYEYAFSNPNDYNSIKLIKSKRYSIENTEISITDVQNIQGSINICDEPTIPFPQADRFERVINLCELLHEKFLSKKDITQRYAFDMRQTNYYADAGIYLGLIEKKTEDNELGYELTQTGKDIFSFSYKKRQLALCQKILEHKVFNLTLDACLTNGVMPDRNTIIYYMKQSNLYNIDSESTYSRRASTINSWIEWIVRLWAE